MEVSNVTGIDERRTRDPVPIWVLEAVFKGMNDAIVIWSEDDHLLYCSDAYLDLWGFPRGYIWAGRPMAHILRFLADAGRYGPGDPADLTTQRIAAIHRARKIGHEVYTRADGRTLRVRHTPAPGFGHVTIQTDITDHLEGERIFQDFMDRSPVGIGIISTSTDRRLFVNHAMVRMFGAKDKTDMLSRSVDPTWVDSDALAAFRELQKGDVDVRDYPSLRRKFDGTEMWLMLTSRHLVFKGEPARVVWHQDVTPIKEAETQMRELNTRLELEVLERTRKLQAATHTAEKASKAKSEFLACISHEFRTPLNAISGYAEIMKMGVFGEVKQDKYKEYIDDILKASDSLKFMIEEILDLSSIENGQIVASQEVFDPRTVIAGIVATFEVVFVDPNGKSRIIIDSSAAPSAICFDPEHFRRIVTNIATNALKFSPSDEKVMIKIDADQNTFRVAVSDNGPGIEPQHIETIRRPFFQIREGHQIAHDGLGLGLHIVNVLCDLNGADLTFDSRPGHGTTVSITGALAPQPKD